MEVPLFHRFDGLLIQPEPERFRHLQVLRQTFLIDQAAQHHRTFQFRDARLLGVFRVRLLNRLPLDASGLEAAPARK